MDSFFFKVEHDLLRSESFKTLGGSAIKVYLVVGLYADFGTGWAYPSIRTIAKQAGLSRQTVLAAIEELTKVGLLATSKAKGKSTAYKVLKPAPGRPPGRRRVDPSQESALTGPNFFEVGEETVPISLEPPPPAGPISLDPVAHFFGPSGPEAGPKQEPLTREDNASIPIPGTPFRLAADGRLLVAVDLQELLTDQGIPKRLAERLAAQKAPGGCREGFAQRALFAEPGETAKRAGLHPGWDRGWVRTFAAGGEPAGRSAPGAGSSDQTGRGQARKSSPGSGSRSGKCGHRAGDREPAPAGGRRFSSPGRGLASRADRPPEPDLEQPVRARQGLRTGGGDPLP